MNFYAQTAKVLKDCRLRVGMTQAQVAKKAGMKVQQLQRYERASYRGHKIMTAIKIIKAMNRELQIWLIDKKTGEKTQVL